MTIKTGSTNYYTWGWKFMNSRLISYWKQVKRWSKKGSRIKKLKTENIKKLKIKTFLQLDVFSTILKDDLWVSRKVDLSSQQLVISTNNIKREVERYIIEKTLSNSYLVQL